LPSSMIAISYLFSQKHGAAKMAERHENARHFWRHSCPACPPSQTIQPRDSGTANEELDSVLAVTNKFTRANWM
jgi:hypothetical protein